MIERVRYVRKEIKRIHVPCERCGKRIQKVGRYKPRVCEDCQLPRGKYKRK